MCGSARRQVGGVRAAQFVQALAGGGVYSGPASVELVERVRGRGREGGGERRLTVGKALGVGKHFEGKTRDDVERAVADLVLERLDREGRHGVWLIGSVEYKSRRDGAVSEHSVLSRLWTSLKCSESWWRGSEVLWRSERGGGR